MVWSVIGIAIMTSAYVTSAELVDTEEALRL